MKTFRCHVGLTHASLLDDVIFLERKSKYAEISNAFRHGSAGHSGPTFSLKFYLSKWRRALFEDWEDTDTIALHNATYNLLGHESYKHALGVDEIVLLFSNRLYDRPNVFGMMFDLGNTGVGDWDNVPRQACTVFVDAIKALRDPGLEYEKEMIFTTIHELGHVFNLEHIEDNSNYMSSSDSSIRQAFDETTAFRWDEKHRTCLRQCVHSSSIHPGGSSFFSNGQCGETGGSSRNQLRKSEKFSLHISTEKSSYWGVEPIELDVTITNESGRAVIWPDTMDPGYPQFMIWVVNPDGSRVKYLPPRRYCSNPSFNRLEKKASFKRDISIFIQSTGYLFKTPGVYSIEVEWQISKSLKLISNIIEIEIKPTSIHSKHIVEAIEFLDRPKIRDLLYFRMASVRSSVFSEIEAKNKLLDSLGILPALHYSAGRAQLRISRQLKTNKSKQKRFNSGIGYLTESLNKMPESTRRYEITQGIIEGSR